MLLRLQSADRPRAPPPGRPRNDRDNAKELIRELLASQNDRSETTYARRWEKDHGGSSKTFWRAVDEMKGDGEVATDGGIGTRKQTVLHLIGQNPHP